MVSKHIDSTPLRVLSLESRRGDEMRSLIERHGGLATVAPSMREIVIAENAAAFAFGNRLFAGGIDVVVFMTGVGATALMEALETRWSRAEVLSVMSVCRTVVRGPKPAAVLSKWGLRIDDRVPEPNTWRDLLSTMETAFLLSGKTIAIQEYGKPSDDLYYELIERNALVVRVPVYRWALPEDVQPLIDAVRQTVEESFDLILFTSAQQFHHIMTVADTLGLSQKWLEAANRCVVASIGPTATETLRDGGLPVDLQPTHPRMGPLVRESLDLGRGLLLTKRGLQRAADFENSKQPDG